MPKIAGLTGDEIIAMHYRLVEMFAEDGDPIVPPGPRGYGELVHSAAFRPMTSLGNIEKYQTVEGKAAALFHSLVVNHPFHNGNKRTALVALVTFLDRNGRRLMASDDELFRFVLSVAKNEIPTPNGTYDPDGVVDAIRRWIVENTESLVLSPRGMKTPDFLKACTAAGGSYRVSGDGNAWVVTGKGDRSVRISRSTRQLDGQVIKSYLTTLRMSPTINGFYYDEFQDGLDSQQRWMRRLRNVLKQLAHT